VRATGWVRILAPVVAGRKVVREAECLEAVLLAGRKIGPDWVKVIAHCMRGLGWRLRPRSRTYVPRVAKVTAGGAS
jgi:hypothetical protein